MRSLLHGSGMAIAMLGCLLASSGAGSAVERAHAGATVAGAAEAQLFRQRVAEAHALARDLHDGPADAAFSAILSDPRFAALSPVEQRMVLSSAGLAAIRNGRPDAAADAYARAVAMDSDQPDDWYRLSAIEFERDDLDASAVALTGFIERWPDLLPNIDLMLIQQLIHRLDGASPARLAYLQALFDANWSGPATGASNAWLHLATMRLERGEHELARAAVRRIDGPDQLVALRSDRRFDPYVDRASWSMNVRVAAEREADRLRVLAQAHPEVLEPRVQLGYALLAIGRNEDVIALADTALADIAADLDGDAFGDIGQQVWLMNNRAIALRRLGRIDDAVDELGRASLLGEGGTVNVSQALNLGDLHCKLGQARQARAAIAAVGHMSGYGRMVQAAVRHCAAVIEGDAAAAAGELDYIVAHGKDAPLVHLEALLLDGRLDDAASAAAALLASPHDRSHVLHWLQEFLAPEPLPGQARLLAAREALLARPDMRAAIDRVGRIERHDIYAVDM